MKFDAKSIVDFPTFAVWGKYYSKFRGELLQMLSRYNPVDREDAVEFAFDKLMNRKSKEAYSGKVPSTELEWFWALYWQAKSYLGHMAEHEAVHERYVAKVGGEQDDLLFWGRQGELLDKETYSEALPIALNSLIKEHNLDRQKLEVFIALEVYRKPVKMVAEKYGLTENNVYQIKFRVGKILRKYGKRHLGDALKQVGKVAWRHTA